MILIITVLVAALVYILTRYDGSCKCGEMESHERCSNCGYAVSQNYNYCPNCREILRKRCEGCGKMIDVNWRRCPYCEEDLGAGNMQVKEV